MYSQLIKFLSACDSRVEKVIIMSALSALTQQQPMPATRTSSPGRLPPDMRLGGGLRRRDEARGSSIASIFRAADSPSFFLEVISGTNSPHRSISFSLPLPSLSTNSLLSCPILPTPCSYRSYPFYRLSPSRSQTSPSFVVDIVVAMPMDDRDSRSRSRTGFWFLLVGRARVLPLSLSLSNLDGKCCKLVCAATAQSTRTRQQQQSVPFSSDV